MLVILHAHKSLLFVTVIININDKEALFLLTRTDNKGYAGGRAVNIEAIQQITL
jgi:hypothetical protein